MARQTSQPTPRTALSLRSCPTCRWDSNPRHFALQATAPPTELPVQLTHTHYLRHVQVLYCIDGTSTVAKEFGVLQFL